MRRWSTKPERRGVKMEKQEGVRKSQELKSPTERISMELLGHRIDRLEKRTEELTAQYQALEQSARNLLQSFEPHSANIAKQVDQDEMWSLLLEHRFTRVEVNLFFSYVVDMLQSLHSRVLEKKPGYVNILPTFSSILKRKAWDKDLEATWISVCSGLGLDDSDEKALCTYYVTFYNEAEYYPASARKMYNQNIKEVLNKAVSSHILHHCLLQLVQLAEKEDSVMVPDNQQVTNPSTAQPTGSK